MSAAPGHAPHELLNDGFAPPPCDLLVVGCGNILRGDDAVGPILVRHLWEQGVPDSVRMVDGGTAGMDVAFQMRGAERVVIVDAAATGQPPGTIFRVPGEEIDRERPVDGIHTHSFRWDHALSFSRWLLGPECPTDVTVFLIEAANLAHGAELTSEVRDAMEQVAVMISNDHFPAPREETLVELTVSGHLRIPAGLAREWFPADACGVAAGTSRSDDRELLLVPLHSQANGGQLLKQRNAAGDRVILVREELGDDLPVGKHPTAWDQVRGALVVRLAVPASGPSGDERQEP